MNGRATGLVLRLGALLGRRRARLRPVQAWLSAQTYAQGYVLGENGRVRVAAVQFPLRLFASALDYARECFRWTEEAVKAGAHLIVFPEMVGFLPLLGLMPGLQGQALPTEAAAAEEAALVQSVTRAAAPVATRVFRFTFQNLARRFGVHIAAGSAIAAAPDGTLRNLAYLFGPDGFEAGHQAKGHLYGAEFHMGLTRGGFVQAFDTPVGRIACPVCMDHTYFETARTAALLGAEILLDPAADSVAPYNWNYQLRGVWGRVQEVPCYGVQAMMVGDALGMSFTGRSGAFGPVDLVGNDGVLALADTHDRGELVVADLDLQALRAFRESVPVTPRYDWCARQLGSLWAAPRPSGQRS